MIRVLRAADRAAVPWKNGGGITREVAVWPRGAGFDDFDWRVSIAEVSGTGPFSTFHGIDRTMTILRGRLALRFAGRTVELDTNSEPFSFPGDATCEGMPVGGPVTDLNVMTRRGRAVARVERLGATGSIAASCMLIVATAPTRIGLGGGEYTLDTFDAASITEMTFTATGQGYAIAFA